MSISFAETKLGPQITGSCRAWCASFRRSRNFMYSGIQRLALHIYCCTIYLAQEQWPENPYIVVQGSGVAHSVILHSQPRCWYSHSSVNTELSCSMHAIRTVFSFSMTSDKSARILFAAGQGHAEEVRKGGLCLRDSHARPPRQEEQGREVSWCTSTTR